MAPISSYQVFATVTNTITFLVLCVLFIVFEAILSPFHQGFFCNDTSIQYPYKKSTVSVTVLVATTVPGIIVCVVSSEVFNYFNAPRKGNISKDEDVVQFGFGIRFKKWIYRIFSRLLLAASGFCICMILTGLGKIMVGRPRPHFLAVCKPDYSKFNCSSGYISFDVCTGTNTAAMREARLSFPSGHSSAAAFIAIFLVLYVEYVIRLKKFLLLKPFLQLVLIGLALACSFTRLSDYFHHWSDVLAGFLLGTLLAFYTIYGLMKLPSEEEELRQARYRSCESLRELEDQPLRSSVALSNNVSGTPNINYNATGHQNSSGTNIDI